MGERKDTWVESAREGATTLRRLRDELALRAHLAGLEGRDAWARVHDGLLSVERTLERLGERMTTVGEEAKLQTHLAVLEARERWDELEAPLSVFLDGLDQGSAAARRAFDRGRVQAHLARLEARDALEPLVDQARTRLARLGQRADLEVPAVLVDLVAAIRGTGTRALEHD